MYQALYRKWRPKTFSDVIGQSHITETLQKQVADRFDEMRRRYRDAHPELTSRKRWADVFEQQ